MKLYVWLALTGATLAVNCMAQTNTIAEATQLEVRGDFQNADIVLSSAIKSGKFTGAELHELEWERDLIMRIRKDYSLTQAELFAELKTSVKDLTQAEFEGWIAAGWFDSREIDGVQRFFNASVSNLFFRHPELNPRRTPLEDKSAFDKAMMQNVEMIKRASRSEKSPYVLPRKFQVTMTVTAKTNAAAKGDWIQAWIPIPRHYPFQGDFKLLNSSSSPKAIGAEDSPIRSIQLEQKAQGTKPTEFRIDYEYTTRGVHFDLDPAKIEARDTNDLTLKPFLDEAPHVVFTSKIRDLSAEVVGKETNSLVRARKIYEWLSDHLLYSYALEYSTIPNISEYCRANGYGDCGQQALLFITLCRFNGIPARWQSGWNLFPGVKTIHDWTEIYLPPYGWLPVDPYMGNYAMRYARTLNDAQKKELRDFFFGGLDHYRMIANSDHNAELTPTKKSFRSDDVDFQRGELESNGRNIYFDKFNYRLDWKELTNQ